MKRILFSLATILLSLAAHADVESAFETVQDIRAGLNKGFYQSLTTSQQIQFERTLNEARDILIGAGDSLPTLICAAAENGRFVVTDANTGKTLGVPVYPASACQQTLPQSGSAMACLAAENGRFQITNVVTAKLFGVPVYPLQSCQSLLPAPGDIFACVPVENGRFQATNLRTGVTLGQPITSVGLPGFITQKIEVTMRITTTTLFILSFATLQAFAAPICTTEEQCLKVRNEATKNLKELRKSIHKVGAPLAYENLANETQKPAIMIGFDQAQAEQECDARGSRLPTARELALDSTQYGNEIIEAKDVKDPSQLPYHSSRIDGTDVDGKPDTFYLVWENYHDPKLVNGLWYTMARSSSIADGPNGSKKSHVYVFNYNIGSFGIYGLSESLVPVVVRCIDGSTTR